uniref:PX domain-containing protein n=1 Tax=Globisporangium ultimum (strain ATCC 200006 / CBS 805.95 / DAOM BR144) TaxID=431595 RepID=K3WJT7_GLOUD
MVLQTASVLHTTIAHVAKPTAAGAHTHTQYLIRVSDERYPGLHWTVYRRYSEFRDLRLKLEGAVREGDMCDHCAIMAKRSSFVQFPHRKWFGNLKESTLETRRVGLEAFLDAVTKHARTCKESMTCQTRPLMDQFLMVNDMRYSFLNVNMSEHEVELMTKFGGSTPTTPVSGKMASTPGRLDRLSAREFADPALRLTSTASNNQEEQEEKGPTEDQNANNTDNEQISAIEMEGRVLKARLKTMPNLLAYSKEKPAAPRKPRTQSWNDDSKDASSSSSSSAMRPNSLSDWGSVKFQTQSAGRHSDPGANSNDLLNFSRGSITGSNRPRRSDQRSRARKVHLSSAAKRVKKLRAEARSSAAAASSAAQRVAMLPTIAE